MELSSLRSVATEDVLGPNTALSSSCIESSTMSISNVLEFIYLIAPSVVLHFSEFSLHCMRATCPIYYGLALIWDLNVQLTLLRLCAIGLMFKGS